MQKLSEKLSDELLIEKWAAKYYGDGSFRVRVYNILRKLGITAERSWEITNLVQQYAAAYSHFFDVNDDGVVVHSIARQYAAAYLPFFGVIDDGVGVYPIWNFIEAMTYKIASEEFEKQETSPKQKSRLIESGIARMRPRHQSVIIQYTWAEDLTEVLRSFEADFPANFPIETFFTARAAQIREAIENEEQVIEHVENKNSKSPKGEVAAYIDAVDDLKQQILKTLTLAEPVSSSTPS